MQALGRGPSTRCWDMSFSSCCGDSDRAAICRMGLGAAPASLGSSGQARRFSAVDIIALPFPPLGGLPTQGLAVTLGAAVQAVGLTCTCGRVKDTTLRLCHPGPFVKGPC